MGILYQKFFHTLCLSSKNNAPACHFSISIYPPNPRPLLHTCPEKQKSQNLKIHFQPFYLPYARHYNLGFVYFLPQFYNQKRLILQTILVHKQGKLSLKSAVYNQERFQIKSGL